MSYMTRVPGYPDRDDIRPGMAHFEGTGPAGKTCESCAHRGYWRVSCKSKFNTQTGVLRRRGAAQIAARCF